MNIKKLLFNPWAVTVGGGIIVTLILDNKNPLFSTLKWLAVAIFNTITCILCFEIQVWVILVSLVAIIILIVVISALRQPESSPPNFLNYKQDRFKRWIWKWDYTLNYDNKYVIDKLRPLCPECSATMHYSAGGGSARCPQCTYHSENYSYSSNDFENIADIERLILDKIERDKTSNTVT